MFQVMNMYVRILMVVIVEDTRRKVNLKEAILEVIYTRTNIHTRGSADIYI